MRDDPVIGVDDRELDDATLEALAEAYATPPPPLLRERILGEARRDVDAGRIGRVLHRWRLVGAVAAGAALALGVLLSREQRMARQRSAEVQALASANAALTERVEEQVRSVASLREALAAQAQVLRVVGAPAHAHGRAQAEPGSQRYRTRRRRRVFRRGGDRRRGVAAGGA